MRVALLLWPITMEGGLGTRSLHTARLFQRGGHEATFFRLAYSDSRHLRGSPELVVRADRYGLHAAQWTLSITDKCISETLGVLDSYDLLVFLHAAPHVTDRQRAVKNWYLLYTEPRGRKLAYFSDQFAAELYPWITEVVDEFSPVGVNRRAAEHAAGVIGRPVPTLPAPYVYEPADPSSARARRALWTSGWRRSKGVMRFVDAAPRIDAEVAIYGVGRDLDSYRRTDGWRLIETMVAGAATPEVIESDLRTSTVSCDFTGQSRKYEGHYNRATIEPMLLGAVSAVLPTMPAPASPIPREAVLVVDPDDVAGSLNALLDDELRRRRIAEAGYEWARSHFCPDAALDSLLSLADDTVRSAT